VKKTSLSLPLLLLSILFLSACSNTPNSLQLTPRLDESLITTKVESDQRWLLDSQDLRTARYLIAISAGDDVATLIGESNSTRTIIEKTLQTHWSKQGHRFTSNRYNRYKIEVQLIKLLAEVEQATLSHESEINVVLKVQLSTDKTTFSKTFRSHYEKKGALNASVKTLTEQLNAQLSQLLDQIVQDPELNDKLLQL